MPHPPTGKILVQRGEHEQEGRDDEAGDADADQGDREAGPVGDAAAADGGHGADADADGTAMHMAKRPRVMETGSASAMMRLTVHSWYFMEGPKSPWRRMLPRVVPEELPGALGVELALERALDDRVHPALVLERVAGATQASRNVIR